MKGRVLSNKALIGIAGVHYVVSELSRHGIVALPTIKNTPAYDIVAVNQEGTRHANIQVKASSKKVSFFPMPSAERVRTGRQDFYVFVRWLEEDKRYQGFLLRGKQAKLAVEEACSGQRKRMRIKGGTRTKLFPNVKVQDGKQLSKSAKRWEKAWENWGKRFSQRESRR
jgi:hypothetical protein